MPTEGTPSSIIGVRTLSASAANFADGTIQGTVDPQTVTHVQDANFVLVPGDGGATTTGGTVKGRGLGANTNSAYRQHEFAVVRQTHHELGKCSALAVRPEPVEGSE